MSAKGAVRARRGTRAAVAECPHAVPPPSRATPVSPCENLRYGRIPVYCFPREDVHMEHLKPSDVRKSDPRKGETAYWSVRVGDRLARDAAWVVRTAGGVRSFLTDNPDKARIRSGISRGKRG